MDAGKRTEFLAFRQTTVFIWLLLFFAGPWPVSPARGAQWFATQTGSGTTCSQATPCSLETAITQANDADTVYVAAGTYTGTGENVVTLTRSVLLYGGWDGAGSGTVVRNPKTHLTTLDGENARRVILVSGTSAVTPTIDGFTIANGNATGLITDCAGAGGNPDGCGGGLFAHLAGPTVTNNTFQNNRAATVGTPGSYTGYGGGLYLNASYPAMIRRNLFSGNIGSTVNCGAGGGVYLYNCYDGSSITDNRFLDNTATTASGVGWGGAINLTGGTTQVEGNTVQGNTGSSLGSSQGSGIYVWGGGQAIRGNLVSGNHDSEAVYLGYFTGTFWENRVVGNDTTEGVRLVNGSGTTVSFHNNFIAASGSYALRADGYHLYPLTFTLTHNTLAGSGGSYGLYLQDYSTVTLTNNIVTGFSTQGVHIADPATCTLTQDHTLFWNNTSDGERGTSPVDGDPKFLDAASHNYHLGAQSAATDAGVAAGVTTDIDGQSRPKLEGYDIGADEYVPPAPGLPVLLFSE